MDIKQFLKLEFSGWKRLEVIALISILLLIFVNAVLVNDSPIAVISAVCGIMYTVIAGKGKISCYFFGLIGSSFYGYLAFHHALYGNLFLYVGYYIPMQILGFFQWQKHLDKTTHEIIKTRLSKSELVRVVLISIFGCLVAISILKYFKDGCCYIDGITTVLSLVGMYLTVKRCIEQWIVWTIVNVLSILMWVGVVMHGGKTYSTVIMWIVYLVLGIYFFFKWKGDMSNEDLAELN